VDTECTLHNFIVLAICVPKINKFNEDLTKFWQKQAGKIFCVHNQPLKAHHCTVCTIYRHSKDLLLYIIDRPLHICAAK